MMAFRTFDRIVVSVTCAWCCFGVAQANDVVIDLQDDPRLPLQCVHADPIVATTVAVSNEEDGTYLYRAGFKPASWSGVLRKSRLTFNRDESIDLDAFAWDAGEVLALMPPAQRRIYTLDPARRSATIPFAWDQISAVQQGDLSRSPDTGLTDQLGEKRLAYLRGDRQLERSNAGGVFRNRHHVLGDIVNSRPLVVGAPSGHINDNEYRTFATAHAKRPSVVYVGANDGMLHAFDARSGAELFAYVPHAVFPALPLLTSPVYTHRTYVDGSIAVAEAKTAARWRTILVGGMRGGAQGVFALDVTEPGRFEQGMGALWEFTDADDPDVGNVTGTPAIARLKTRVVKGVPEYRYFAVVPNGLNSNADDGVGRFNRDAPSTLFFLALDKAKTDQWMQGVNYFKFSLPATDSKAANGLIDITLVKDANDTAIYGYAGDLQGNLWRFDFTGSTPWGNASVKGNPKLLFVAKDNAGNRQPITQRPAVVHANGGYTMLFGTGQLLESRDLDRRRFRPQSFYAIRDVMAESGSTIMRNQLAERILKKNQRNDVVTIQGAPMQVGNVASHKGWYVDFLESGSTGERSIVTPEVADGSVYFNTVMPGSDACKPASSRSYFIEISSGLPVGTVDITGYLSDTRIPTIPLLLPTPATAPTPLDAIGRRKVTRKIVKLDPSLRQEKEKATLQPQTMFEQKTIAGRLSWRELINWGDVRFIRQK